MTKPGEVADDVQQVHPVLAGGVGLLLLLFVALLVYAPVLARAGRGTWEVGVKSQGGKERALWRSSENAHGQTQPKGPTTPAKKETNP